jgi:hypothetical protein
VRSIASPEALVIDMRGVQVAVLAPATVPTLATPCRVIVRTVFDAFQAQVEFLAFLFPVK